VRGHKLKSLQKDIKILLEASQDHLLAPPPSHFGLQKVRGWLGVLFERMIIYTSNGNRTANSVKRILGPFNVTFLTSKPECVGIRKTALFGATGKRNRESIEPFLGLGDTKHVCNFG